MNRTARTLAILALVLLCVSCASEVANQDAAATSAVAPPVSDVDTITNSIGMKLVEIPAGEFIMGGNIPAADMVKQTGEDISRFTDQFPQHQVVISKPFYMGQTEVTRAEFEQFVVAESFVTYGEKVDWSYSVKDGEWVRVDHKNWRNPYFLQGPDHPVISVTYSDLVAFCKWLSEKEGKTYRLPTEAEWEYAYRAGSTTVSPWGDSDADAEGWGNGADLAIREQQPEWTTYDWNDGYAQTSPVAQFKPNPFGLYDMFGNVWEWCDDLYGERYYDESPEVDPAGPEESSEKPDPHHSLRGGSWSSEPFRNYSGWRDASGEIGQGEDMGFRIVMEIED